MPNILVAYPIDYISLILTEKLKGDTDNDVTLFIDRDMNNAFFTNAVQDLQCMSAATQKMTYSRVF